MDIRQIIKQTLSENNRAYQTKNRKTNSARRFSTINQLLIPLKPSISVQDFQNHYFLRIRISAVVQELFRFMLGRLEQACLVNDLD